MLIDVLRPDLWDELNEDLKTYLGLASSKIHVRAYHGLPHAIFETCKGTALHMAHKKYSDLLMDKQMPSENKLDIFTEKAMKFINVNRQS